MDIFQPGSSVVDWCETNYNVTYSIAEFFNTITNALFFIIPPIMIYLFKNYSLVVTKGINIIWLFLVIVGIGSVYFHSTLTLAGQLMDELSILWVLMTSYTVLFPDKLMPRYFNKNKHAWYFMFFILTIIISYLCFLKPELNAYFLMIISLPIISVTFYLLIDAPKIIKKFGIRIILIWFLAVTCWTMDRVFCDNWLKLGIPYLHGIFHILIFVASQMSVVLYAYFTAKSKANHLKPILAFWPNKSKNKYLTIPYIDFEYFKSNNKPKNIIGEHTD